MNCANHEPADCAQMPALQDLVPYRPFSEMEDTKQSRRWTSDKQKAMKLEAIINATLDLVGNGDDVLDDILPNRCWVPMG